MPTVRVPVDAARLARDFLATQTDLVPLVAGRVYVGRLPPNPVFPLIMLHRVGGAPRYPMWLDPARLQIEGWADVGNDEQAHTVAATALAALMQQLPGRRVSGTVAGVTVALGLTSLPDQETARPRVLFDVTVPVHP